MNPEIDDAGEPQQTPLFNRPRVAFPLIFVATLLFQLPYFDLWYAHMDEGHVLMFADIVAKGGEIYRDATIYPLPGAFYLLAYAFKLFGPSVILSRWMLVLIFSAFVPLVFSWLRTLVPLRYAWSAVVVLWLYRLWAFPHWQIYSYSTTALFLLLCSMMCLLHYFRTNGMRSLVAAGFCFGLGVAFKQDYGAALMLAALTTLGVFSLTDRSPERRPLFATFAGFILPGAAVGLLLAAYFLYHGILEDLIQLTVLTHMRGLATFEYPEIPAFFPFFSQDERLRDVLGIFSYYPGIIFTVDIEALRTSTIFTETPLFDMLVKVFFYFPYPLIAFGALRLLARRSHIFDGRLRDAYMRELLLFGFGFGLLMVLTFNKPQDYVHFAVVYWPFLILAIIYLHALLDGRRVLAIALAAVMIVPAGATLAYSVRLVGRLQDINSDLIPGERSGIYAKPAEARLIEAVVDYVQANTEPDEIVSVIPYFPMVQFLMDRLGPHRSSYIVWPFPEFEDRDERIIQAMDEKQVGLVIYNFTQFVNFPLMSEFAPKLFAYVVDNYRMSEVFSFDYSGYKMAAAVREPEPRDGRPVLDDPARQGFLRIEPEVGPPIALAPEARESYLLEDLWPFRPVVSLRPTADGARSVLAVEVEVPEDARLVTAVGVNPREWFVHPSFSTSFALDLVRADGTRESLFARTLKPHTVFEDRGWFDVDVSLADHAGSTVTLEFATSTQLPAGESIWGGGWQRPRLLAAPGPDRVDAL